MPLNKEKLARMQAQVRTGGKGSVRRKKKAVHKTTTTGQRRPRLCATHGPSGCAVRALPASLPALAFLYARMLAQTTSVCRTRSSGWV